MTDDLIPWLHTQLDEDERIARAVEDRSPPWDGQWKNDGDHALRTYNGWVLAHNGGKPYAPGLLDHIARHDPARVLAEVDAKRALIAETIRPYLGAETTTGRVAWLALRLLALPYAAREGYQERWRP